LVSEPDLNEVLVSKPSRLSRQVKVLALTVDGAKRVEVVIELDPEHRIRTEALAERVGKLITALHWV